MRSEHDPPTGRQSHGPSGVQRCENMAMEGTAAGADQHGRMADRQLPLAYQTSIIEATTPIRLLRGDSKTIQHPKLPHLTSLVFSQTRLNSPKNQNPSSSGFLQLDGSVPPVGPVETRPPSALGGRTQAIICSSKSRPDFVPPRLRARAPRREEPSARCPRGSTEGGPRFGGRCQLVANVWANGGSGPEDDHQILSARRVSK